MPAPSIKQLHERILIIDDELAIVDLLIELLSSEGYSVEGAGNGAEALAKLKQDESVK